MARPLPTGGNKGVDCCTAQSPDVAHRDKYRTAKSGSGSRALEMT